MAEKTLVTFNLDEDRKAVWEDEADERGRSLSGFIRHAGEKEIAGREQSQSGGVDHTEELSELHEMLRSIMGITDGIEDSVSTIHREISIPDETKEKTPEVVRALPIQRGERTRPPSSKEGITVEEIGEETGFTLLKITQCLNHAEEQTGLVEHDVSEDGTRRWHRRV